MVDSTTLKNACVKEECETYQYLIQAKLSKVHDPACLRVIFNFLKHYLKER